MAKSATTLPPQLQERLGTLGATLRARRKALRLSAVAVAEAAHISRVTLHRIERGEASVAMGSYFSAAAALGVDLQVQSVGALEVGEPANSQSIPIEIRLSDYPELGRLGWQLAKDQALTPREALDIYERNRRHIDEDSLTASERRLMENLRIVFGGENHDV